MKEFGGYIEFEYFHGNEYHDKAIKLNCGRNCLAYLIKLYNINFYKIYCFIVSILFIIAMVILIFF